MYSARCNNFELGNEKKKKYQYVICYLIGWVSVSVSVQILCHLRIKTKQQNNQIAGT